MKQITDYISYYSKKFKKKIAIEDGKFSISYFELEKKINSLSGFFNEISIKKGDRVGIYLDNSVYFVICVFAVLKVGAIFVPLNNKAPVNNLSKTIEDCKPRLIICSYKDYEMVLKRIYNLNSNFLLLTEKNIDTQQRNIFCWDDVMNLEYSYIHREVDNKDPAYIMYTSGSTGKSKGVTIKHESLMNFIKERNRIFGFNADTRILSINPFYFDGALPEIFCPMLAGGYVFIFPCNILLPRIIAKIIFRMKITYFGCSPDFLKIFITNISKEIMDNLRSLKAIAIGGDVCNFKYVKIFMDYFPTVRLFNTYGPTECTIAVTHYAITKEDLNIKTELPIGKAVSNVRLFAFDSNNNIIEPGKVGELYISGIQVMAGYWNDLKLTEKVLVRDKIKGELLYKTGDLVTVDHNNNYIFRGRIDNMIKRYGYRIYPVEIENVINELVYVKESVCIACKKLEDYIIIAFIMLEEDATEDMVMADLKLNLPEYMIPDRVQFIGDIPYTRIGKIDRNKLTEIFLAEDKTIML